MSKPFEAPSPSLSPKKSGGEELDGAPSPSLSPKKSGGEGLVGAPSPQSLSEKRVSPKKCGGEELGGAPSSQAPFKLPTYPEHLVFDEAICEALRQLGADIGERVAIHPDANFDCPDRLVLEDDVQIGPDVRIIADSGVRIGARTIVGAGAKIISTAPRIPTTGPGRISEYGRRDLAIHVEHDCYIGPGVLLLPGANVGHGVVVEPGLVLSHRISEFKIMKATNCSRQMARCG